MVSKQDEPRGDYTLNLPLEKHFYSIGEVGQILHVTPAMLRNWERRFPQLKPSRTSGNHRQYTREQVQTVAQIQYLLQTEGLTFEGARARLRPSSRKNTTHIELVQRLTHVDQLLEKLLKHIE